CQSTWIRSSQCPLRPLPLSACACRWSSPFVAWPSTGPLRPDGSSCNESLRRVAGLLFARPRVLRCAAARFFLLIAASAQSGLFPVSIALSARSTARESRLILYRWQPDALSNLDPLPSSTPAFRFLAAWPGAQAG